MPIRVPPQMPLKEKLFFGQNRKMTRVNDQAEEDAKKMETGKLEKREETSRLQTSQKERQSPDCRITPKSTSYPRRTGRPHSTDKRGQRRESQLKCYRCGQDFQHTDLWRWVSSASTAEKKTTLKRCTRPNKRAYSGTPGSPGRVIM
ncbi:hypothetical protein NDU88_002203 [Pleurodeles waltl]|uniref:Uncharacterized protein n=1 Tax=Pleurodeles waltl TaxID=8319 RepID=A0AAV7RBB0_PLEWA|nr:hypothetical protein NDU88_002203 [Pleurodeles waltl]